MANKYADAFKGNRYSEGGNILQISIEGLGEAAKKMGNARQSMSNPKGVARDIARLVTREVKAEAPQGRTHALRDGIRSRVQSEGGGRVNIEIVSDEPYVAWVILGRGWVFPVKAKRLHWVNKAGKDVFAMKAKPTKPNPFPTRAWKKVEHTVEVTWGRWMKDIIVRS